MDNKTLVALQESINDWEKRARDKRFVSERECPLCTLDRKQGQGDCKTCIIKERTGEAECHNTPFWNKTRIPFPIYEQNEIAFLKSFLPKDKEESKMKFVIKDDMQGNKNIKVELSLGYGSGGFVKIYANNKGENRKILMVFKDGQFKRCWGAQTEGVNTNSHGQIIESERG